jgi:hypothetical protein
MHAQFGNVLLQDSLVGEGSGFGDVLYADLALGSVGVADGNAVLGGSNQVVQAALRASLAPSGGGNDASGHLERALSRAGRPLPPELLQRLERAFGVSLGDVRLHDDAAAALASDAVNAHAVTVGTDILFGRGELRPGTPGGDELIAHEVTHVVQHLEGRTGRASAVENGVAVTLPTDAVEAEAYAMGHAFAHGLLDGIDVDAAPEVETPGVGTSTVGAPGSLGAPAADGAVAARDTAPATNKDNTAAGDKKRKKQTGDKVSKAGNPDASEETQEQVTTGGKGGGKASGGGMTGGGGGGSGAEALKGRVTAYQDSFGQTASALPKVERPAGTPDATGSEDHGKKVEQYEDGVDGIADQIGDLDAFDALCDACDDKDTSAQRAALSSMRSTKGFKQLSQMWQGAKDGGDDRGAMEKAFDNQFDGRGFWGSTEDAFDLVCREAKAAAKENAEAAEAKRKKKQADAEKRAAERAAGNAPGKTQAATGAGTGGKAGQVGGAASANLDTVVAEHAEEIPSFTRLSSVTDIDFDTVAESAGHFDGLSKEFQHDSLWSGRTEQIFGTMFKEGGGAFLEGFKESAMWGTIATFGDRLLGGVVEKALGEKIPIIGPIIALATDNPFSAKYWEGVGTGFTDGWHHFESAFDWSAFEKCGSVTDYLGVVLAKFADLFGGLYDVMNQITRLIGTLSAVCLLGGAVLIAIGLALVWFFGVGAPLIAAGGWLVDAGMILGDIALVLTPIVLALSALAMVFRTAAAFLVPADLYAEQLAGVGSASEHFGEQAGAKAGEAASQTIEHATAEHEHAGPHEEGHGHDEHTTKGAEDSKHTKESSETHNDHIEEKLHELTEPKETKETKPKDEHGKEHDESHKEEHSPSTKEKVKAAVVDFGMRLMERVKATVEIKRNLERAAEGFKELGENFRDPKAASERGAGGAMALAQEKITSSNKRLAELGEQAQKSQAEIDGLLEKLTGAGSEDLSPGEASKLYKELENAHKDVTSAKNKAQVLEERIKNFEALVEKNGAPAKEESPGNAAKDESGAKDSPNEKLRAAENERDSTRKKLAEAEEHQEHLEEKHSEQKRQLEEAKKQKQQVEAELEQLQNDPKLKQSKDAAANADSHNAALEKTRTQIAELQERATKLEQAETKRNAAVSELSELKGHTIEIDGKPVKVVSAGPEGIVVEGNGTRRTLPLEEAGRLGIPEGQKKAITDLQSAQKHIEEAANGDATNPSVLAEKLRTQADWLEQNELRPSTMDAEKKHWDGEEARGADWKKKNGDAQESVKQAGDSVEKLQAELDKTSGDLRAAEKETTKLEGSVEHLEETISELGRERAKHKREETNKEKAYHLGHHVVEWLLQVTGLEEKLEHAKHVVSGFFHAGAAEGEKEGGEEPKKEGGEQEGAKDEAKEKAEKKKKVEAELLEMGEKQAKFEELMEDEPPLELEELSEHRKEAAEAAERYHKAHDYAYKCYVAELAVTKLAEESGALAAAGKPLLKRSTDQEGPLQKSAGDEEKRGQALSNADSDSVEESDPKMSGIVSDLIVKLADNADRFDKKPEPGGVQGDAMAGSQDTAATQAEDRTKDSQEASDTQRQFLDDAIALRQEQESSIEGSICTLETKQAQELAIRDTIRSRKAEALAEEAEARTEVEEHATAFNDGYDRMRTWAGDFEARRAALKGAGGGE